MTLPPPSWENGPALPAGLGDRPLTHVVAAGWAARLAAEGVTPGVPVGHLGLPMALARLPGLPAAAGQDVERPPVSPPQRAEAVDV